MEPLIDQLCAVCDARFYQSPPGQSVSLFLVALLDGTPVVEPQRLQVSLQPLVRASKMPASFLVVGLIRAIEDVLDDCSRESLADPSDWSLATQRLIGQDVLVNTGGVLTVVGETRTRTAEQVQGLQADLERWWKLTAVILVGEHLEQAIYEELDTN